jgi:DNA repair exonuclease SbcCD ATPase subunit
MNIKIILENINCHEYLEVVLERGKMTLIKGDSGIGKSSIFQGISWCLYRKIKGICRHGTTKYSVTLTFSEFTIYRRGKPRLLQVIFPNNTILEDESGQKYIDQYFGNESIFNATCYLEQDSRSKLLDGSNSERMEIINLLSSWLDNPDIYIETIDQEIKNQQKNFLIEQTQYNTEVSLFSDQLSKKPVNPEHSHSKEELLQIQNNIKLLDFELIKNQDDINTQNKLIGSIDILNTKLNHLVRRISELPSKSEIELEITRTSHVILESQDSLQKLVILSNQNTSELTVSKQQLESKIMQLESINKQRQSLESSIKNYTDMLNKFKLQQQELYQNMITYSQYKLDKEYTREEYYTLREIEKNRNNYVSICNQLQVEYTSIGIESSILKSQNIINQLLTFKSDIDIGNKIYDINLKIKPLIDIGPTDIIELKKLQDIHTNMIMSFGLLTCPHCNKSVRYSQGTLRAEDRETVTQDQINQINLQIEKLKKEQEMYTRKVEYQNQIIELSKLLKSEPGGNKDIENLGLYKNILITLQGIKILPTSDVLSEMVLKSIDYSDARKRYESFDTSQITFYEKSITEYSSNLNNLSAGVVDQINALKTGLLSVNNKINEVSKNYQDEINSLKAKIKEGQTCITNLNSKLLELQMCQSELSKTLDEIVNLKSKIQSDLENKLKENKLRVTELREMYDCGVYFLEMYEKQIQLNYKAQHIMNSNYLLTKLYEFKQKAFDLECERLQVIVDSLNESLNSILQDIFEKPIKVLIQLYKKNKTNDKVKSTVNLYIQYDGNEYDSINKLSGGEKDRISFALTLALNIITASPLLLLDETLRSLNESYRTNCIEAMKSFLGESKTILCINHEDTEGNYDTVINLSG